MFPCERCHVEFRAPGTSHPGMRRTGGATCRDCRNSRIGPHERTEEVSDA